MTTRSTPLRVLSIEGGGVRGLYASAYLAALAKRYADVREEPALDIGKGFDLIAGTSTGAVVACALAVGLPLDAVSTLYREHARRIFPLSVTRGLLLPVSLVARRHLLKKGAGALEQALDDVFGATTLADVWRDRGIALAIPAVTMDRHRPWIFKTRHFTGAMGRDDGYKLVDVCLATTAAPIFRSLARVKNPDTDGYRVFLDGGLWANNPVLVAMIEALEFTEPGDSVEIFCLGTIPPPPGEAVGPRQVNRGLFGWRFGARVAPLSISAQASAFNQMARKLMDHLDRNYTIVQFPRGDVPATLAKYLDLDESRPKALDAMVGQAKEDVDHAMTVRGRRGVQGRSIESLFLSLPRVAEGIESDCQ